MIISRISVNPYTRMNTTSQVQNFGKKKSDITDYKFVEDTIEEIEKNMAAENQHLKNIQTQFDDAGNPAYLESIRTDITNKIEKLKTRLEKYTKLKNNLEEKLGLAAK